MSHPQTSASTDSRAEGPLSLPEYGAGGAGFYVDSTVAGPYLTGIVTSGSYIPTPPKTVAVAAPAPTGKVDDTVAATNIRELGTPRGAAPGSAASASAPPGRLPTGPRPAHLRRGADRCVLLLPAQNKPDSALMASLNRRNVETLICFDPHDVVARLCLMAREVQTAERKGLLPLPGGIALIVCEPTNIPLLASVVHTVRRYAARCVCWQFAPASTGAAASLRPLSDDEILRAGDSAAPRLDRTGAASSVQSPVAALPSKSVRGMGRAEPPGLRLANWVISQADNSAAAKPDTLNVIFPAKNEPLTSPELAMLLTEFPEIPSPVATSPQVPESRVPGPGHGNRGNGETSS